MYIEGKEKEEKNGNGGEGLKCSRRLCVCVCVWVRGGESPPNCLNINILMATTRNPQGGIELRIEKKKKMICSKRPAEMRGNSRATHLMGCALCNSSVRVPWHATYATLGSRLLPSRRAARLAARNDRNAQHAIQTARQTFGRRRRTTCRSHFHCSALGSARASRISDQQFMLRSGNCTTMPLYRSLRVFYSA